MARHQTPRTLNDNLRLGRLTLPQWAALVVGAVSLWAWSSLAAGVRDPNAHILLATMPTVLTVAPILAFFRGGIERYPQQVVCYGVRRGLVYSGRALSAAHHRVQKGIAHAAVTLRQRRERRA